MHHRKGVDGDDFSTDTLRDQIKTEKSITQYYYVYRQKQPDLFRSLSLLRQQHISYCLKGLNGLSSSFDCLDASRPWLCYWILHSLDLLGHELDEDLKSRVTDFLGRRCQNENGGFGGGPGQLPHLAPTYASVLSLCIINTTDSLNIINRDKLRSFIISLKDPKSKGYRMHKDGEVDVRGAYTALAVASLLNIDDEQVTSGVDEYVQSCQTFEGGIGSFHGNEAHGGYAFCGLAALMLCKKTEKIDIDALSHWAVRRQMSYEGGFQGRTNKLVDACYSFWMGSMFPLIHACLACRDPELINPEIFGFLQWTPPNHYSASGRYDPSKQVTFTQAVHFEEESDPNDDNEDQYPELDGGWYFDETALQEYLLLCCQSATGGLFDKPGKSRDYYHTCYSLSGLSVSQHQYEKPSSVLGNESNLLRRTNPIINITVDKVESTLKHFGKSTL